MPLWLWRPKPRPPDGGGGGIIGGGGNLIIKMLDPVGDAAVIPSPSPAGEGVGLGLGLDFGPKGVGKWERKLWL